MAEPVAHLLIALQDQQILEQMIGDVPGPMPALAMLPSDSFHTSLPLKS